MSQRFKLRILVNRVHAVIARSPMLSRLYLLLWGLILRSAGRVISLEKIISTLISEPWPSIAFPARMVWVTNDVSFRLVPHTCEFDMRALFGRDLHYEPDVFAALDRVMQSYDAIVEIGANVGVYTLFFCDTRRSAEVPVYCFEPSAEAFARLNTNLAINEHKNVYAIPAAIAARSGLISFFQPVGHLTNGSMLQSFASIFSDTVNKLLVPALDGSSIHTLVEHHKCLLLKIDVEGAEAEVLRTLQLMIEEKLPDIVIEVLQPFESALNQFPWPQGYKKYAITPDGLVVHDNFVASDSCRDYFVSTRAPLTR